MSDLPTREEIAEWYRNATDGEIDAALQAVFVGGYKRGRAEWEASDVYQEAVLLVESILPTDNGWEETARLRTALGVEGDEQ